MCVRERVKMRERGSVAKVCLEKKGKQGPINFDACKCQLKQLTIKDYPFSMKVLCYWKVSFLPTKATARAKHSAVWSF